MPVDPISSFIDLESDSARAGGSGREPSITAPGAQFVLSVSNTQNLRTPGVMILVTTAAVQESTRRFGTQGVAVLVEETGLGFNNNGQPSPNIERLNLRDWIIYRNDVEEAYPKENC